MNDWVTSVGCGAEEGRTAPGGTIQESDTLIKVKKFVEVEFNKGYWWNDYLEGGDGGNGDDD